MAALTKQQTVSTSQGTFQSNQSVTADGEVIKNPSLTAAKTGTLTTRTSNSVGTLTMTSGHGITNGARLDVYWIDPTTLLPKCRYGCVVGTVATDSVPLTGGAGENLPVLSTSITAMVPQLEDFMVTAADMQALVCGCAVASQFVFLDGSSAVVAAILVTGSTGAYVWLTGSGVTTPFGSDVEEVYLSHASSEVSAVPTAEALVS